MGLASLYYPTTCKEAGMTENCYRQTVYFIRDHYVRVRKAAEYASLKSVNYSGVPAKTNKHNSPVEDAAERREKLNYDIEVVEKCLEDIPEEYRKGLLDHLTYDKAYPLFADKSTWSRWKTRLVIRVAIEKGFSY